MKKLFSCLLAAASFVLALTGFSACTKNGHDHAEQDEHIWLSVRNAEVLCEHLTDVLQEARATSETLSVVCTVFPLYDWVRNIVAGDDGVSVTLLQKSGSDLHNYQPTAGDIRTIYSCDIFVYVGGESDDWIGDVLPDGGNSANHAMVCIDLLEALGERALAEEEVPGAEEHNHDEASAAARPVRAAVGSASSRHISSGTSRARALMPPPPPAGPARTAAARAPAAARPPPAHRKARPAAPPAG